MLWLQANWGTLLVLVLLAGIVAAVVCSQIKDKRAGKSSCGNNCAHCAMQGKCHQPAQR